MSKNVLMNLLNASMERVRLQVEVREGTDL